MGADGHIAIFDAEKVKKIIEEINTKYDLKEDQKIYFCGYFTKWECNGKKAAISYWGDNATWCGWGAIGSQLLDYYKPSEQQLEFAERIVKEAILVEDQEVWT